MAEYSAFGTESVESVDEIYQLDSEYDSDDENFVVIYFVKDRGADSTCLQKSDVTVSGNSSGVEHEVQIENFADQDNLRTEKSRSVLDPNMSAQDVHKSSGESNSFESSIDRAYVIKNREVFEGSSEFVVLEEVDNIDDGDIHRLMERFITENYSASFSNADLMVSKCRMLFRRDYHCEVIDNSGGVLCDHYPARLIIPVAKKLSCESTDRSEGIEFDSNIYIENTKKTTVCRLRKRFVIPVIMFDKKFICRSATISVRKTAVFETAIQSPNPQAESVDDGPVGRATRRVVRTVVEASSRSCQAVVQLLMPDSIKKLRDIDVQILRDLKVQYICDLMTEKRKKYHVTVGSSEKADRETYSECNIEQMPYPGCEFFKKYHNAKRNPQGLVFDWQSSDIDTELKLTEEPSKNFPDINWDNYKEWDIVELTKNYMKILLLYLAKGEGGLLVHCVSGWDRTPLFISILRISLWADGVIHESLDYRDMAYLTLTYDWYLFGHNLHTRLSRKEEIMHFCFEFLKYIVDDEFSVTRIFNELPIDQRGNGSIPDFIPGVRTVINDLRSYVLNVYDQYIPDEL